MYSLTEFLQHPLGSGSKIHKLLELLFNTIRSKCLSIYKDNSRSLNKEISLAKYMLPTSQKGPLAQSKEKQKSQRVF